MIYLIYYFTLSASLSTLFIIWYQKRQNSISLLDDSEWCDDDIVKVEIGRAFIFLRRCEVENFNSQPRKMRKHLAKEYQKKIAKGIIVPIYENGEMIGCAPRFEAREFGTEIMDNE